MVHIGDDGDLSKEVLVAGDGDGRGAVTTTTTTCGRYPFDGGEGWTADSEQSTALKGEWID
jgi:hypothetical protein